MATAGQKDPGALLTIGELSQELGVAQHILRYWETRFPQLKPMQRAGNRRYYRASDVELARKINRLLNEEGYTVRGVQKVLRGEGTTENAAAPGEAQPTIDDTSSDPISADEGVHGVDVFRLIAVRNRLAALIDS